MIDYSELQLSYHSRFITYLTNVPSQPGLCIRPSTFEKDLLQKRDAMVVVCSRFLALRTRTSAILDTVCYTPLTTHLIAFETLPKR